MFFITSWVTDAEIYDGTANTYLIGEKYLQPETYETGSGCDDNVSLSGCDWDTLRDTNYRPYQDRRGWAGSTYIFGSVHSGSFGMTMVDGSVHRISYTINAETHRYLGDRRDEKVIKVP